MVATVAVSELLWARATAAQTTAKATEARILACELDIKVLGSVEMAFNGWMMERSERKKIECCRQVANECDCKAGVESKGKLGRTNSFP